MDRDAYTVSMDTLIALADRHGRKITPAWITKYQRRGLLPPQKKPGLGRAKGKPSHYTPELAHQLVPLIFALELHGKNLAAAGWGLWWQGWHVDARYWWEPLLREAGVFNEALSMLTPTDDDDDRPDQLLQDIGDQLRNHRSRERLIGAAKRYGGSGITDLLSLVSSVFVGNYMPLKENACFPDNYEQAESQKLLAKTFGLPVLDTDIPKDNTHFPVSIEALDEMFSDISGQFQIDFEGFIRDLPEPVIVEARNQIALLVDVVGRIEKQNQEKNGRSAGAKVILWAHQNQKQQLAYLIGWLVLRQNCHFRNLTDAFAANLRNQIGISKRARNAP
jgi:hypothetical protein